MGVFEYFAGMKSLVTIKYLLGLFCCFAFLRAFSQEPPDRGNDPLLRAQLKTAHRFMSALEAGQVADALALIDPAWSGHHGRYEDSLKAFSTELQKYKGNTTLSVVIVWPAPEYNTYLCRYYNTKGEFFNMSLDLAVGQPGSLVRRITKIPAAQLKKDREELARSLKKHPDTANEVPPPQSGPPPPPAPQH